MAVPPAPRRHLNSRWRHFLCPAGPAGITKRKEKKRMIKSLTVENGDLVVRMQMQEPTLSSTKKTFIVASTGGFTKTGLNIEGKQVSLNLTATIKAPPPVTA